MMIGHSEADGRSHCLNRDLLFALSVGRLRGAVQDEVERHLTEVLPRRGWPHRTVDRAFKGAIAKERLS